MILPDSQLKEAYDKFLKIKEKSMKEREEKMSTIKKNGLEREYTESEEKKGWFPVQALESYRNVFGII